jgi:hypothetical protein
MFRVLGRCAYKYIVCAAGLVCRHGLHPQSFVDEANPSLELVVHIRMRIALVFVGRLSHTSV